MRKFLCIIFILSILSISQSYSQSEREWVCEVMKNDYYYLRSELRRDPFAECMARPENQKRGRTGVCVAEANGTRIGQAFSRQKLEDLERDIRDKCF